MLNQLIQLKRFFSWRELLSNARSMRQARSPLRGYVTTVCFWALMDVGLLEDLGSQKRISRKEFAQTHGLNLEILSYLSQYLERCGYLKIRGDEIAFTARGSRFWREVQGVFRLFHAYEPLFSTLSAQLRQEAFYGKNLSRREEEVALGFSELGRTFLFRLMEKILMGEGVKTIIDLGCQEVELGAYLCVRHPAFRCLGIDVSPDMVKNASHRIQALGLDGRLKVLRADMFDLDRAGQDFSPYEAVTAIDLFHGSFKEGEEKLLGLFKKLRKTFTRQKFLISEICLPPAGRMKKITYPYVEHELFHDLTGQKSFQEGELESLLERSGFRIEKKWNFNRIAGRVCLLAG